MKTSVLIAACALLGLCQAAVAQVPVPTLTKIRDFFIQELSGIDAGMQPRLIALGTPASKKVLGMSLRVRIFSLASGRDRPEFSGTRGHCHLYISSTYPVQMVDSSLVLMPTSYEWLDASPLENAVRSGRYWMVLESGEERESEFFMLHRDHIAAYFDSGMLLEIRPTAHPAKVEIMKAFRLRRTKLEAVELSVAQRIGSLPCYGFKKLIAESDTHYTETIAACPSIAPDGNG